MTHEDVGSSAPGMWRFMDAANLLTLLGLVAAESSMLLAMNGWLAYAVMALMLSGGCDLFDG
jgi:phosphatidylserine synthase